MGFSELVKTPMVMRPVPASSSLVRTAFNVGYWAAVASQTIAASTLPTLTALAVSGTVGRNTPPLFVTCFSNFVPMAAGFEHFPRLAADGGLIGIAEGRADIVPQQIVDAFDLLRVVFGDQNHRPHFRERDVFFHQVPFPGGFDVALVRREVQVADVRNPELLEQRFGSAILQVDPHAEFFFVLFGDGLHRRPDPGGTIQAQLPGGGFPGIGRGGFPVGHAV